MEKDTKTRETLDGIETQGSLSQAPDSLASNRISFGESSKRSSVFSRLQSRGSAIGSTLEQVGHEMFMELRPSIVPVQQVPVGSAKEAEYSGVIPERRLNSIVEDYPDLDGVVSNKWICEDGIHRSGNTWTATGHILTAVLGSGVLALPYAMASLGWILGAICFVLFAWITLFTAQLLADLYIVDGVRQRTFPQMVKTTLGVPGMIVLGIIQQMNLVLTALAYTVTAAQSMIDIAALACSPESTSCFRSQWAMGVIFGGVQLGLSQVPDLESFWWASALGAIMSLGYSMIALGLGIGYHNTLGGIAPKSFSTTAQQVWNILNSIGAILFAYSFSIILLEIQDTMSSEKGKNTGPITRMKRAVNISVAVMTGFYISVACSGFASQGYDQDPYILTQFQCVAPAWVLYMANAMVIIHLVAAYQVWSQPHFALVEEWVEHRLCKDVQNRYLRYLSRGLPLRLVYRSFYVVVVTFLAVLLPFFQSILGFVGAIGFWPMTVFFPIQCYIRVFRPGLSFRVFLRILDLFCFLLTLAVIVASFQSMIQSGKSAELFSSGEYTVCDS